MRGHWTGHHGSSKDLAEGPKLRVLDDLHVLLDPPRSVRLREGEKFVRHPGLSNAL
jgi:hypothetical protein